MFVWIRACVQKRKLDGEKNKKNGVGRDQRMVEKRTEEEIGKEVMLNGNYVQGK